MCSTGTNNPSEIGTAEGTHAQQATLYSVSVVHTHPRLHSSLLVLTFTASTRVSFSGVHDKITIAERKRHKRSRGRSLKKQRPALAPNKPRKANPCTEVERPPRCSFGRWDIALVWRTGGRTYHIGNRNETRRSGPPCSCTLRACIVVRQAFRRRIGTGGRTCVRLHIPSGRARNHGTFHTHVLSWCEWRDSDSLSPGKSWTWSLCLVKSIKCVIQNKYFLPVFLAFLHIRVVMQNTINRQATDSHNEDISYFRSKASSSVEGRPVTACQISPPSVFLALRPACLARRRV